MCPCTTCTASMGWRLHHGPLVSIIDTERRCRAAERLCEIFTNPRWCGGTRFTCGRHWGLKRVMDVTSASQNRFDSVLLQVPWARSPMACLVTQYVAARSPAGQAPAAATIRVPAPMSSRHRQGRRNRTGGSQDCWP